MKRRLVLVAVVAMRVALPQSGGTALVSAQAAEKARLKQALVDLLNEVSPYANGAKGRRLDTQSAGFTAARSVLWLQEAAEKWAPKRDADGRPLRESIERMTRALHDAPDDVAAQRVFLLIAEDLEDKETYCRANGLASRRRIRVITKRDAVNAVPGLEVLYVEKFLEANPKAQPRPFRRFSSPAEDDLVPGRYVFWARQPGSAQNGPHKDGRVAVDSVDPIEVLAP
jgi:hypothetical protein